MPLGSEARAARAREREHPPETVVAWRLRARGANRRARPLDRARDRGLAHQALRRPAHAGFAARGGNGVIGTLVVARRAPRSPPASGYFFFPGLPSSRRCVTSVGFLPALTASIHAKTSFISGAGIECPAPCSSTITS